MKLLLKKSQIPPHLLKFFRKADGPPTHKPKDLVNTPCYLAESLRVDGWYLRSEIQLTKLSPMPESCRDRCTRATEKLYLLSPSARYFYDQMADSPDAIHAGRRVEITESSLSSAQAVGNALVASGNGVVGSVVEVGATRNHWDYWEDSDDDLPPAVWPWRPEPKKKGSGHYATFPLWLPLRVIRLATSARGCCGACGAPWKREVERVRGERRSCDSPAARLEGQPAQGSFTTQRWDVPDRTETLGWSPSCRCPAHDPTPCRVLDCFAGLATVGVAARLLGRCFTGIELSPAYAAVARERLASAAPLDDAAWHRPAAVAAPEQQDLFAPRDQS